MISSASNLSYVRSVFRFWKQSLHWKQQISLWDSWQDFSRWRQSCRAGRDALGDREPWITFTARDFLDRSLKPTSRVFEWGSGGSTLFLLERAGEVHTIEHDEIWFGKVQQAVLQRGYKNWNGKLIYPGSCDVSDGKCDPADWRSYQSGDSSLQNCDLAKYVQSIDQFQDNYFDVIIVDGRARPSCLYHAWRKLSAGGLLILDNAEVSYYRPISGLLTANCSQYLSFAGAGPYITTFWLTNAWRKPVNSIDFSVIDEYQPGQGAAA